MKTLDQMRRDIQQGVLAARSYASDIQYSSEWISNALRRIAAEAERAAKNSPDKDVLLVAIGKLAGAITIAVAYQAGRAAHN